VPPRSRHPDHKTGQYRCITNVERSVAFAQPRAAIVASSAATTTPTMTEWMARIGF